MVKSTWQLITVCNDNAREDTYALLPGAPPNPRPARGLFQAYMWYTYVYVGKTFIHIKINT